MKELKSNSLRRELAALVPAGDHPDADVLTAFVEGSLLEREQQTAWRPCHWGDRASCHPALYFGDSAAELMGRRDLESRIRAETLACTRTAIAAFTVQKRGGPFSTSMRVLKQHFARSQESNRSAQ